jgi:hypothetical protein
LARSATTWGLLIIIFSILGNFLYLISHESILVLLLIQNQVVMQLFQIFAHLLDCTFIEGFVSLAALYSRIRRLLVRRRLLVKKILAFEGSVSFRGLAEWSDDFLGV